MWKCTVCKKDNQDTVLRCQCGFDRRYDYEKLRTLVKLDAQDIQKYQRMKIIAQEAIKPKVEVAKPVVNQPKVETAKPVVNQPKVETTKQVVNQPKVEATKSATSKPSGTTTPPPSQTKATPPPPSQAKTTTTPPPPSQAKTTTTPPPSQAKTATTATTKPAPQPVKTSTASSKPTDTITFLKKTILPKTKLDWLVLVIGAVLLCMAIWPDDIEMAYFFTSEVFCAPLSELLDSWDWNTTIFVLTISYILMYQALGQIQYEKRKGRIILYAIASILPLCYFGDVAWGIAMNLMVENEEMWELASIENLTASWFILQLIIILLAFLEDPTKTVAKRKARNMSIFPQSKLQMLVLAIGIALAVIFVNRENLYYSVVNIEDIQMWKVLLIFWILMYWLGKRLRYTHKFFKVVSYVYFSCPLLLLISDVVWSIDLLRPYVGENGAGWVLTFLASWIFVLSMAIKEEQIKI